MSLGALSVGGRAGSSLKLWWFGQRRTELPGQLQSACAGAEIPRRPTLIVAVAMTMAILRAIFILFTSGWISDPTVGPLRQVWAMARTAGTKQCLTYLHCKILQFGAEVHERAGPRNAADPLCGSRRGGRTHWRRRRDLNPRWGFSPKPA